MFDNKGIYTRYSFCHDVESSGELARILGIARQTTNDWKNGKSKVPWWRLKELVDLQGVSWDWLLCGVGKQCHLVDPSGKTEDFDTKGINSRFLSLFSDTNVQADLARKLSVSQVTVHKWQTGQEQVSWLRMGKAIKEFNVTWDWLIEGRVTDGSHNDL